MDKDKIDKDMQEEINEVNRKAIILLKAAANNKVIRFFCYFGSIHFIFGIAFYFLFRNAEKRFAKRCLLISIICLVLIFTGIGINILLNI